MCMGARQASSERWTYWESDKDMCSELPTAVEAIHAALEDHCQVYVQTTLQATTVARR
jgi:hypothetical protein